MKEKAMGADEVTVAAPAERGATADVAAEGRSERTLERVYEWWRDLHGLDRGEASGAGKRPVNRRGDRAELARCRTPVAVALTPAFSRLRRALQHSDAWHPRDEMLAVLAGVLAHVRTDDSESRFAGKPSFPARLASGDAKPRMSGLRFRRLLKVKTPEELMHQLIDAVRLCDGTASVASLTRDVPWFLHPSERTKRDWALAYFATAPQEQQS